MRGEVEFFRMPFPKPTEKGTFTGLAVAFDSLIDASFGPTVIHKGAFKKSLKENGRVPIYWQHDQSELIGFPMEFREEDDGLYVRGWISSEGRGALALDLMRKAGELGKRVDLSVGMVSVREDFKEFKTGRVGEVVQVEKVRFVYEAKLTEISVVAIGADPKAGVREVASAPAFVDREAQLREAELQWAETEAIIAGTKKPRGKTGAENELALAEAQLDATEGRLRELRAPGSLHAERFAKGRFPLSGKPKLAHKRSVARAGRRRVSVHEYARYVNRRSLAAARALGAHCSGCGCFGSSAEEGKS